MKVARIFILLLLSFIGSTKAQVGTMVGWGMSICNTYSFNICPNQTITPFNYGSQGWACNFTTMADISFNIMGPGWRVAMHNYTFTSTTNGQVSGFDASGNPQSFPFNAAQTLTPFNYLTIGTTSCVVFAINGVPTTYTLNKNTFSISISPAVFGPNNYTLCSNVSSSISISPVVPPAGGPWTYHWQPGNLFGNPVTVSPSATTIYTVTATAGGVCSNTAAIAVTVTNCCQSPTITSNPMPPNVCAGQTTTLIASGAGVGGTYTWNPGNMTGSTITVNPLVTTVYTVNAKTTSNCTGSSTVQVTVYTPPTITINSNAPVCSGGNLNLSGSGGLSYSWNGPAFSSGSQNPVISPATTANSGIYTLTATGSNNCVGTVTQNIIVNGLPNVSVSGATVCLHNTINLSAGGGTAFVWSGPGGYFSSLQNPSISNAAFANSGQYTVTVTDINSCTNTAVANVNINPLPVPGAGSNSPVCLNGILALTSSGGVNYYWNGPNGFFSSSQNPLVTISSSSAVGNYSVTVTDALGCSSQTFITVTLSSPPDLIISANVNSGCPPLCPQFICTSSQPISTCSFDLGNIIINNDTASTCFTKSGTYTVSASVDGCPNAVTYTVNVYPDPVADFNFAPIKPVVNIDQQVQFTDASWGATIADWNWYFMNTTQYTSTQQNPFFSYTEPGTYAVALVVKSDKGCLDTIIKPLVVGEDYGIYVPDAFTPNGDGINDVFQPKGFGIIKYELTVFDRWGENLFTSREFNEGWKGTTRNGEVMKEDVYVWKIIVTTTESKRIEYTGHVTLMK